jgi:hypothetical protein
MLLGAIATTTYQFGRTDRDVQMMTQLKRNIRGPSADDNFGEFICLEIAEEETLKSVIPWTDAATAHAAATSQPVQLPEEEEEDGNDDEGDDNYADYVPDSDEEYSGDDDIAPTRPKRSTPRRNVVTPSGLRTPMKNLVISSPVRRQQQQQQQPLQQAYNGRRAENFTHEEKKVLWMFLRDTNTYKYSKGELLWTTIGEQERVIVDLGLSGDQLYRRFQNISQKRRETDTEETLNKKLRPFLSEEEIIMFKNAGCRGLSRKNAVFKKKIQDIVNSPYSWGLDAHGNATRFSKLS